MSRARRSPRAPRLHARWRARVDDFAVDTDVGSAGVAVASASGTLSVFDLAGGSVRWARNAHAGGVLATAWSPRAPLLASAGQDGKARLWDASGSMLAEVAGDAAWVEQLAWSPDGEHLAIGAGRLVQIVRPSGSAVARLGPHASTVTSLAWNRRGERLAAAHYGGVTIWTARTGKLVRTLAWKGSMISLAWSPDGRVVVCGEQDASVHFWRLASGEDARMGGYTAKVRSLAWDVQSSLLATAGEPDVIVWDFRGAGPEGTQPLQFAAHREVVGVVEFAHLFGYPEYAVDFFAEAAEHEAMTGEFVEREFIHIPTFESAEGRFVYAVPEGHQENADDIALRTRAAAVLERYTELRAASIGDGKPGVLHLVRSWFDDGTGRCSPRHARDLTG